MADETIECRTLGCENLISKANMAGFCFSCLAEISTETEKLHKEVAEVLRRAAEFDRWCAEHGLPDPHDK